MRSCRLLAVFVLGLGTWIAAAQDKPDIRPRTDLRGSRGAIEHLSFHPDGKQLVSADAEGKLYLWNLETCQLVRKIYPRQRHTGTGGVPSLFTSKRRIEAAGFTVDGKMIAEIAVDPSRDNALQLWNPEDGEPIRTLAREVPNMRCLAFSPDGKLIATNERDDEKWGHKIVLRELETGKVVAELSEKKLAATSLAFSPDGKKLASAGARTLHIWDVAGKKLLHKVTGHKKSIQSIGFSPDGTKLVTGSTDDTVRIWNVETGKMIREIVAEQEAVRVVAFSKSGKSVASGGDDKSIKVWKSTTGTLRNRLWGHLDKIQCLAFSPDGKTLVSGGRDRMIAVWDVDKFEVDDEDEEDEEEWGEDWDDDD